MKWNLSGAYLGERRAMVEQQLRARGIRDQRVLHAMLEVPRHEFVPPESQEHAYADHPLPIGAEQTISQPFIIAVALQALALTGSESVLEVGTGSGFQTALLARMTRQVYSVERHAELAERAQRTLEQMGFGNITISVRDGSQGWPDYAPYDAILVSAAAPSLPKSLVEQLGEGGRMVIPIGPPHAQELQLISRNAAQITRETVEGCRFVPLVGVEGY